jgi:hypothetical protein
MTSQAWTCADVLPAPASLVPWRMDKSYKAAPPFMNKAWTAAKTPGGTGPTGAARRDRGHRTYYSVRYRRSPVAGGANLPGKGRIAMRPGASSGARRRPERASRGCGGRSAGLRHNAPCDSADSATRAGGRRRRNVTTSLSPEAVCRCLQIWSGARSGSATWAFVNWV